MKKLFFAFLLALISVTSVQAQKLGHVNSQKVLDTIPSRKKAIAEIGIVEQNGLKELRGMDSTLQTMIAFYQSHPEWSDLVKRSYEGQIRDLQTRIQTREQAIDQELQTYSAEVNQKTLDLVKKAVSNVSTVQKLNYVIDESVLLFNSGGTDITNAVITEVLKLDAANK